MGFSKEQIVSKRFSKKWTRGLSEFEVRDFLHVLAEQIRQLNQENLLLKKDLQDRERLIKDYRDREHILKESIANAENWAQKIKQDAESHRQLVLEKAQSDSENLIESARQSLQTVYNDIADLKRLQLQFKSGLKVALQVQLDLLENDTVFNPGLLTDVDRKNKALSSEEPIPSIESPEEVEHLSNSLPDSNSTDSNRETEEKSQSPSSSPSLEIKTPKEASEIHSLRESLNSLNKNFS